MVLLDVYVRWFDGTQKMFWQHQQTVQKVCTTEQGCSGDYTTYVNQQWLYDCATTNATKEHCTVIGNHGLVCYDTLDETMQPKNYIFSKSNSM